MVLVSEAVRAAGILAAQGIKAAVIDMHTIKPIDKDLIVKYAEKTDAVVTCENHQIVNGLGSAVAEVLIENKPVPMKRIGVNEEFGEVGTLDYLKERFGFTAEKIAENIENFLKTKKG